MRRGLLALALVLALPLAGAGAAAGQSTPSLPDVSSGARPGPPVLYAPPPTPPPLRNRAPFRAAPLLVSGTDAYRRGEFLYQDHLFDDRGADTVEGQGTVAQRSPEMNFAPTAGDVLYPTAERFAGNAADLVELRVRPTRRALVYRATLNTALARDTAVVGIGLDVDRAGAAPVAWPRGAGVTSPGLDRFITAFGTGGIVTDLATGSERRLPAGAVSISLRRNQMTIRVPRTILDPGRGGWRHVAGVGLWDAAAERWKPIPARRSPDADTPATGDPTEDAPAVLNLAFRFDEPQIKNSVPVPGQAGDLLPGLAGRSTPLSPYTTFPGIGNWFEDKQALALKERTTRGERLGERWDFHADIDFARLAARRDADPHPPGRKQARILPSSLDIPEGVRATFPEFGGPLQPYVLIVPPSYRPDRPAGLTFSLHSLGGAHTQFAVFDPNQLEQFGDQRDDLVVTPLGRGPDGWYIGAAEFDFFEVWRDVAHRFRLDPDSVALSGYSMGGYGTYRLGAYYPDLFGRAFTTVGPPARGVWLGPPTPPRDDERFTADTNSFPILENVRWLPYLNWVELTDQLVPYVGPRAQQTRFDALGLRSSLWTFAPGDHFTLAILDQWAAARDFLGRARVRRNPPRVNYAFLPATASPSLGLRHDHAYWVSGLRARDARDEPDTDPARAEIDARSRAFGVGEPRTERFVDSRPDAGPPQANVIEGTRWTGVPRVARRNALEVDLANVARSTIAGRRARLNGRRRLCVTLRSDGRSRLRLNLPLPAGATVRERPCRGSAAVPRVLQAGSRARLDRRGATFSVPAGTRTFVIEPGSRRGGAGPGPRFTG